MKADPEAGGTKRAGPSCYCIGYDPRRHASAVGGLADPQMPADFRRFGGSEREVICEHLPISADKPLIDRTRRVVAPHARRPKVDATPILAASARPPTSRATRLSLSSRWPVVGGLAEAATGLRPASSRLLPPSPPIRSLIRRCRQISSDSEVRREKSSAGIFRYLRTTLCLTVLSASSLSRETDEG